MYLVLLGGCQKNEVSASDDVWEISYVSPGSYQLISMHFRDNDHGAILANVGMGSSQRLIYSDDGGLSWAENEFRLDDGHLLSRIYLFGDRRVMGITTFGEIMESLDFGQTWTSGGSSVGSSARQIVFPYSESYGFVAAVSTIYKTTDGGINWSEPYFDDSESDMKFTDRPAIAEFIQFPSDPTVGYAVGGYTGDSFNGGSVLKTTDGGGSWKRVGGMFADILSASFVSNEVGYLFINDRRLWWSQDGGHKWDIVNNHIPVQARASHFISAKVGFLVDADTGIWTTGDGGTSWNVVFPIEDIPTGGSSNTLFCQTEQTLYLMINGTIMLSKS